MSSLVPQEELRQEFARRRLRQLLVVLPVALAVISLGQPTLFGIPSETLRIPAIVIIAASLLFSFWNWRCPSCNRYVGKAINPRFCAGCGMQFRD